MDYAYGPNGGSAWRGTASPCNERLLGCRMMYRVVRSTSGQRVSETVRQAIKEVCRTAFYYKGDVRGVFLSAGLPPSMWDRHDHGETSYKVLILKNVLADLRGSQKTGARQIERNLVEELCRFDEPHAAATNPAESRRALAELKRLAQQDQLLVNPEQAEVESRRKAAAKRDADELISPDIFGPVECLRATPLAGVVSTR
jgi:hypothetical protein